MIIKARDFNVNIIAALNDMPRKRGNQGTKARPVYKDAVCAFDIETSYIPDLDTNVLYIWQFQLDEAVTIIGRMWAEFIDFVERVNSVLKDNVLLCVFIHNASYEFQFIRSLFSIPPEDVFVIKSRRILKFTIGHFEFRCSYLQSNLSLAAFTEKFDVKHKKLDGTEFDYSKTRYPDTPLSDRELEYCVNDVRGLVEALKSEMARDGDNLYTIPLTSTGYVRRDVKRVLRDWGRYKVNELLPTVEVYTLLREAFRGGNTHANRYFVKNPEFPLSPIKNVHSADRSSSYPDVQVNHLFPMTPFKRVEKSVSYSELKDHYIVKRGYALLFRIQITGLELRDFYNPCPYISLDKSRKVRGKETDNGRLIAADYLETTVTDIDFKIIDYQYKLSDDNVVITDLYFSRYDYLPDELRALVKGYYTQKTELKGVSGKELYYDKFKNLINAIYGCSAQDPAKDNVQYLEKGTPADPVTGTPANPNEIYHPEGLPIADLLSAAHPTMPYQWGVWTTARARELLQVMIDAVHENPASEFVYTDTDSVKYIGDFDLEIVNARLREIAINNGAYADDTDGNRHYMGIYEYEKKNFGVQFETLGAKSYIYEDRKGELHITIAGVPKKAGAKELQRMGGFSAYNIGAIFHDGITETHYNDKRQYTKLNYQGHEIEITSSIVIRDSFHQIGFANDYEILLSQLLKQDIDMIRDK